MAKRPSPLLVSVPERFQARPEAVALFVEIEIEDVVEVREPLPRPGDSQAEFVDDMRIGRAGQVSSRLLNRLFVSGAVDRALLGLPVTCHSCSLPYSFRGSGQ